jgi:hypothetical protein
MAWDAGIHGGGAATVDVYILYIVLNMYSVHVRRLAYLIKSSHLWYHKWLLLMSYATQNKDILKALHYIFWQE